LAVLLVGAVSNSSGYEPVIQKDVDPELEAILSGFKAEATTLEYQVSTAVPEKMPANFSPWWHVNVSQQMFADSEPKAMPTESLYLSAIEHSTQIKVFSDIPLIRETGIQEAKGAFDTRAFVESKFDSQDDPVGSTLTTGNIGRFEQEQWSVEAGLRKRAVTGAEFSLSQEMSRTQNNSEFFTPNPQAASKLKLSVVQPLLKGAGVNYNRSIIHIAKLDSEIAQHEALRQIESHLMEICRSYWTLYMSRSLHVQQKRLVQETAKIVGEYDARQDVDANRTQVLRARSAYADRMASLVRSEIAIRNSQDRVKSLLNDPDFNLASNMELIPADALALNEVPVDLKACALHAIEHRPEISQAIKQLRSAAIREKMQKNEHLPTLNLIIETYLAGLKEGDDVGGAMNRQVRTGGPGFLVGLNFEIPLENNIADARLDRRRIELRQQYAQFRTTVETVLLEVKVAAREVRTAWRDIVAKYEVMASAIEELEDLRQRRAVQAGAEGATMSFLDFFLDSQDRLSRAEEDFLRSIATYAIAQVALERAQGNLLAYENISLVKQQGEDGLPVNVLKVNGPVTGAPTSAAEPVSETKADAGLAK